MSTWSESTQTHTEAYSSGFLPCFGLKMNYCADSNETHVITVEHTQRDLFRSINLLQRKIFSILNT
jgi:hypothetical protein